MDESTLCNHNMVPVTAIVIQAPLQKNVQTVLWMYIIAGCTNLVILDSKGSIHKGRKNNMNKYKREIAKFTNANEKGILSDVIIGADVFIGVSGIKNLLKKTMIKSMNDNPIVFALTNPEPEINPINAKKAGAKIVATGSYSFQNRVNNALVFPYLMRVILDLKIKK